METKSVTISDSMHLAIKGNFELVGKNVFGIFAILINLKSKTITNTWLFASGFHDMIEENSIHTAWSEYETILNNLQLSGNYAEHVTVSLKQSLHEYLTRDKNIALLIVDDLGRNRSKEIRNTILSVFKNVEKKSSINMDMTYEVIDTSAPRHPVLQKADSTEAKPEENPVNSNIAVDHAPPTLSTEKKQVPAHAVLAPFYNSVMSHDLKVGQKILMMVDDNNPYAKHCAEALGAYSKTAEGTLKKTPIVATVIDIKRNPAKKLLDISVAYNEFYYSRINIEEGIKIKFYDPMSPEKVASAANRVPVKQPEPVKFNKDYTRNLFKDPLFVKLLISIVACIVISIFMMLFI
ncbi:MAG: hypothetical protein ACRCS8_02985 [Brevinema sp.]